MARFLLTRRSALAVWAASGVPALGRASPARAETPSGATRAAAWVVGDSLSLAALLYAQGAAEDSRERLLTKARAIGKDIGIASVPPFPKKAAKSTETYADVIHYLIKGAGAQLGVDLGKRYDEDHAMIFELAVKSNLLILLYNPGDDSGIDEVVRTRATRLKLPTELWMPVVAAIGAKTSQKAMKEAVFKMHEDVQRYLISKM